VKQQTQQAGKVPSLSPRSMTKQAFIKMLLRRTKMSEVTLASSDYPPLADQDLVRRLGAQFSFYLGHGLSDLTLDEDFKVFFPKSLK
jgi:hypothetical protein